MNLSRSPNGLLSSEFRWLTASILSVMSLAAFESIATATIMPVAADDLNALAGYTWAFNAFIVASLLGMVAAGVWCDASGPRAPILAGIGALAVGSIASGSAHNLLTLVAGRAIQGIGAGAVMVSVYVVIARAYPVHLRPKAFSALSTAWIAPSLVGPFIAGWLAEALSWRVVFWLIPVLVVAPGLAMAARLKPFRGGSRRPGRSRRLAAAGISAIGLVLVQDGSLRNNGWGVVEIIGGGAALAWGMRTLLPQGSFRLGRGLPAAVVVHGLVAGAYFSAEMFVPLALVQLRGSSTTLAGLVLTGGAVTWAIGSTAQGRVSASADRSRFVQLGAALVAAFVVAVAVGFVLGVPSWALMVLWACASLGMGLSFPSIAVQAMRLTPEQEQGATSSALQVVDSVLIVMISSMIGLIFASAERAAEVRSATFATMWFAVAAVAGLAVAIAPRMRPRPTSVQ